MYSLNDLRKRIAEEGLESIIRYLVSEDISEEEVQSLKREHILADDGYPCLSLIYSLVLIAQ